LNSTPSDKKTPVLIDIFATLREIVEDDEFRCGCPVNMILAIDFNPPPKVYFSLC